LTHGLFLAAALFRRLDIVVRRDVADDRLREVVHQRQRDAAVAVEARISRVGKPGHKQGEQRDAEGVIGDRFARLGKSATLPTGAAETLESGGAGIEAKNGIEV